MKSGFPRLFCQPAVIIAIAIFAVTLSAYGRLRLLLCDPGVFFLQDDGNANWIRHAIPMRFFANRNSTVQTTFRCEFDVRNPVPDARLRIQAFRKCDVWLDSDPRSTNPLFSSSSDLDSWKQIHEISMPRQLDRGKHVLWIQVTNRRAHACLLASSSELDLATGHSWQTSVDQTSWKPAALASEIGSELPENLAQGGFLNAAQSIRLLWPWVLLMFAISFFWTRWTTIRAGSVATESRWGISPSLVRSGLVLAWIVLSWNNITRIHSSWGFDVDGHLEYTTFVARNWRIPLATDGWQMFQSPLIYLLAAPWHHWFSSMWGADTSAKLIRFIPMLCGVAQIQILYRVGRTIFPKNEDLQNVVLTIGGLLPVNIYMSQVFGNEPLAACLSSLVIWLCVMILADADRPRSAWFFLLIGFAWGLAMLSKVTPFLLTPMIFGVVVYHLRKCRRPLHYGLNRLASLILATLVTCGWYFLRNWIYLGKPFVGGWDPAGFKSWWQDPSYREWNQLRSFGACFGQPVYSGADSYWDALYSSMWADGFLSGAVPLRIPFEIIPWNIPWMDVGIILSVVPMICILASPLTLCRREPETARPILMFAMCSVGVYLAAVTELYFKLPVYSTAKASYLMGLIPCIAVLGAAGAAPIVRYQPLRPIFWALLSCWAMSSYATYFCMH